MEKVFNERDILLLVQVSSQNADNLLEILKKDFRIHVLFPTLILYYVIYGDYETRYAQDTKRYTGEGGFNLVGQIT